MVRKTIVGEFEGQKFTVENTWLRGAKLFHGDELVAKNSDIFALSGRKPIMSATVLVGKAERLVEVFAQAIFAVKLKLMIDGVKVAGDEL